MFGNKSGGRTPAQIEAISRSQAVIELNMDGTGRNGQQEVLDARLSSGGNRAFWAALNRGEASEFKRIAKGGREIWIVQSDPR